MQIRWTRLAAGHLIAARTFITEEGSPAAAHRQVEMVLRAVESLARFPELGRQGRVDGTRELVVSGTPYIVAYRFRQGSVRILALLHGARRWPQSF